MSEQEGFRPTGGRAKGGRCALCGAQAKLTKAHVPPKAAFNKGSFSWGGTTGDSRLAHGRPRLGGASLYAHCEPCRASTSPWDDEYIRWAYSFANVLLNSQWKGQRTQVEGTLERGAPRSIHTLSTRRDDSVGTQTDRLAPRPNPGGAEGCPVPTAGRYPLPDGSRARRGGGDRGRCARRLGCPDVFDSGRQRKTDDGDCANDICGDALPTVQLAACGSTAREFLAACRLHRVVAARRGGPG